MTSDTRAGVDGHGDQQQKGEVRPAFGDRAQRDAEGKAARARVPLRSLGELDPAADRDPVGLLLRQAESRVADLVPVRHGRMLTSPFAFYRGAAVVMAADLGRSQSSGLRVQLCGDAHLANFGA